MGNPAIVLLLGLGLSLPSSAQGPDHGSVECLLEVLHAEVGVTERTGNNDGPDVARYLSSCKIYKPASWCAALPYYGFQQAGIALKGNPRDFAWCPTWFTKKVIWTRGESTLRADMIRPGDEIGIYFIDKGRVAHMGVVYRVFADHVETIEGNTDAIGSREGQGVWIKRRSFMIIYQISRWTPN